MALQKYIADNYNHADCLVTVGVIALIYFAWRSVTVDLAGFGEGIAALLAGRGAHAWGIGKGEAQ